MDKELIGKLKTFTVLYVEDELGIRVNISEVLKGLFGKVFIAKNANEAYVKYLENKPTLIITDIRMSGMNGIELIKKIRKFDKNISVIVTSAHTDVDLLLSATELNLVKYIVKPVNFDKLFEALKKFVETFEEKIIRSLSKDWFYDNKKCIIKCGENIFQLTKKENKFLKLLLNKKRVITYEELENQVWEKDEAITSNAMRLFIKNFRKKLPKNYLKNIQNMGYIIDSSYLDEMARY